MKKRNLAVRLGVVALVLTLVTTSLTSGTLAKYISVESAVGTANVAAFGFRTKMLDEDWAEIAWQDTFDFISTSYASGTTAIAGADNAAKAVNIAPGSLGVIPIVIDCTGTEVGVSVSVTLLGLPGESSAFPSNMLFGYSVDNKDPTSMQATGAELAPMSNDFNTFGWKIAENLQFKPSDVTKKKTFYIHWSWPYNAPGGTPNVSSYDAEDTKYGLAAAGLNSDGTSRTSGPAAAPQLSVTVTGTQMKPTP